ncbi:MAG: hypothetical protein QGI13_13630 [Rhodospirillales bacterium]|nr:hypothetical protein [Rhodospirillales bacterium]
MSEPQTTPRNTLLEEIGRREARIKRKTVIRRIVKEAYPEGLQAAQIRGLAKEKNGIELNPNTVTVTLGRYKEKGIVRLEGKTWFYVPIKERHKTI